MSNLKSSKKRRNITLSVIFVSSVLLAGLIGNSFAQSGSTFTISSGVYPGATDYTIDVDSGNYYAKNAYGAIAFSSSNASYVWNSVVTTLATGTGGSIKTTCPMFEMTNPIVIIGGSSTPPSKTISIIGDGRWATVFKAMNAMNMFEVSNGASVHMESFYIDMNGKNGYGIYGKNTGTSDRSFQKSVINDIEIRGVNAGYWAIYLENPYITNTWDNLYVRSAGGGIYMECDSVGYGNNHFGNIMISLYGNNGVGLKLYRNGVAISLNSFDRVHIDGGAAGGSTGNLGLELDGSNYNSFDYLEIEHCKYAVKMGATQSTHGNVIQSGYFYNMEADGVMFNMTTNAKNNIVRSVYCSALGGTNTLLLWDNNTDTSSPNSYYDLLGGNTGFLPQNQYIVRAEDDACLLYGSMLWRKAQNTIESSNFQINHTGVQTLTITHALCLSPPLSSCHVQIVQSTAVTDWDAHIIEVANLTETSVEVRLNVTSASATNPSYAKFGFYGNVNG